MTKSHIKSVSLDAFLAALVDIPTVSMTSWLESELANTPSPWTRVNVESQAIGCSHDPYCRTIVQVSEDIFRDGVCAEYTGIWTYDALGSLTVELLRDGENVATYEHVDGMVKAENDKTRKVLRDKFTEHVGTSPEGAEAYFNKETYVPDQIGSPRSHE